MLVKHVGEKFLYVGEKILHVGGKKFGKLVKL